MGSSFGSFIFGLVNFAILVGASLWGLRKLARQYFYARQTGIKKKIVESTFAMRTAQKKSDTVRGLFKNFAGDLEKRRSTAANVCNSECKAIEENAARAGTYIIEGAKRQGERAHARELLTVKDKIVEEAFINAVDILKEKLAVDSGREIVKKEMEAFEKNINSVCHPCA